MASNFSCQLLVKKGQLLTQHGVIYQLQGKDVKRFPMHLDIFWHNTEAVSSLD